MGMAASQARLLSITARLSNNEQEQQSVAFSKQRLADNSEQINDAYLEAMNATKYQLLTGYNSSEAIYADLTYNQITGLSSVAVGKQYIVKDKSGKVLVPSNVAKAYENNNGDFNRFLRDLGYTQSDITVTNYTASEEAIHEAWDKYLSSVGKSIDNYDDGQHILDFGYASFSNESYDGYATYDTAYAIAANGQDVKYNQETGTFQYENEDGTISNATFLYQDSDGYYKERYAILAMEDDAGNQQCGYYIENDDGTEQWIQVENVSYNLETGKFSIKDSKDTFDNLYVDAEDNSISEDYKNHLTTVDGETYYSENGASYKVEPQQSALNYEGTTTEQRELYDYALAITEAYYNNSNSASSKYLTYDAQIVSYYKNIFNQMQKTGYTTTSNETNFKETDWLVNNLKSGELTLAYYSTSEKAFVSTTLDDDESIVEKEDSSEMAIAEQVYQSKMDNIESQDKQFDLQLNKLSSEHSELQTEYDAVKKVISNNVEKSFNTFNA